jgi:hypothetical protein
MIIITIESIEIQFNAQRSATEYGYESYHDKWKAEYRLGDYSQSCYVWQFRT